MLSIIEWGLGFGPSPLFIILKTLWDTIYGQNQWFLVVMLRLLNLRKMSLITEFELEYITTKYSCDKTNSYLEEGFIGKSLVR